MRSTGGMVARGNGVGSGIRPLGKLKAVLSDVEGRDSGFGKPGDFPCSNTYLRISASSARASEASSVDLSMVRTRSSVAMAAA